MSLLIYARKSHGRACLSILRGIRDMQPFLLIDLQPRSYVLGYPHVAMASISILHPKWDIHSEGPSLEDVMPASGMRLRLTQTLSTGKFILLISACGRELNSKQLCPKGVL